MGGMPAKLATLREMRSPTGAVHPGVRFYPGLKELSSGIAWKTLSAASSEQPLQPLNDAARVGTPYRSWSADRAAVGACPSIGRVRHCSDSSAPSRCAAWAFGASRAARRRWRSSSVPRRGRCRSSTPSPAADDLGLELAAQRGAWWRRPPRGAGETRSRSNAGTSSAASSTSDRAAPGRTDAGIVFGDDQLVEQQALLLLGSRSFMPRPRRAPLARIRRRASGQPGQPMDRRAGVTERIRPEYKDRRGRRHTHSTGALAPWQVPGHPLLHARAFERMCSKRSASAAPTHGILRAQATRGAICGATP